MKVLKLFLLCFKRQGVEAGAIGGFVEGPVGSEHLVHHCAEAKSDLRFGFGIIDAELDESGMGTRDVGCLRGGELLLDGGDQVGKEVVIHHGRALG